MSEVEWTKEQLKAIEEDRNNVLVAAAAGSGKTAVLVERIINKTINKNIDIDKLLVVTFTNAAASEMRERILEELYKKIDENPENENLQRQLTLLSKASICTIHSFCLDVIKNNFYEIGISPNFRIAEETELEILKLETIEELFEEKYEKDDNNFLKLVDVYGTYLLDDNLKNLVLEIYNFIQSNPFPNDWLEEKVNEFNIKNKFNSDFSLNSWGKVILENVKEEILDCKLNLEKVYKDLLKYPELEKFSLAIYSDIEKTNKILNTSNWDELYNLKEEAKFETWPTDRKITLEAKNIAKDKRDRIKTKYNNALDIINCNSKDANLDTYEMYDLLNSLKELVFEFEKRLIENKKEKNIIDFSDIEHYALKILLEKDESGKYVPTQIAKKYQNKFKEIAIDEYQDSNLVQEYILNSISNGKNMFMVGDIKQSIYKFRAARPELFINKYENYSFEKDVESINSKGIKIQLFKNFRSRKNILDTTNLIFENIMSKNLGDIDYNKDEYLNFGAKFKKSKNEIIAKNTQVDIIENNNDLEELNEEPLENIELEAKYVAQKVRKLIDSKKEIYDKNDGYRPVTYKDIVILLRSTKERANIFEKEFVKLNIPVFSDTSAEYLDSLEIQIMMSLLKIIDNPMQDIPLVCVLRSYIGLFTDNELVKIRVSTDRNKSFYESMKEYKLDDNLSKKIKLFWNKIEEWQTEKEYLNLDELIWKIYEETGYYNYVGLMPSGNIRQANLRSLFEKAKQYEKASFKGLYNFINFIDRIKNTSGDLSSVKLIGENENVIRIMSIHKSKGLEFPVVFLCGSNKWFNFQDLNMKLMLNQDLGIGVNYIDTIRKIEYPTISKEAIKIKSKNEILSEEMRILYVALTRAKERLIITGVSKDVNKDLTEKKEILELYNEDKINKHILKKYKSYLDWIELVVLKCKDKDVNINIINKNDIMENKDNDSKETNVKNIDDLEKITKNIVIEKEYEDILKNDLEWRYKNIDLSKVEAKTSVSKIKQIKEEQNTINLKSPKFLKEEEIITGSRKGTIIHLCMQKLNPKKEYNIEKINDILENMVIKNIITINEKEKINISKIYNFTKTNIWNELKDALIVEKEKPFYINIPAKNIYDLDFEDNILVQGIIDLYYINKNNELILVDYKTDFVQNEDELIEKYKVQLKIYKSALEKSLKKDVDKVYIYSTYLDKEIEIDI